MPRRKEESYNVKFRVEVHHPMPKSEALRLLKRAIRTGIVPENITVHWMDWTKGEGGKARGGEYDDVATMSEFHHAIEAAGVIRAERAD